MTTEQKVTWLTSFSHFITHGYMTLLPAVLVVIISEHSMSFLDLGIIANIGYFLYGLGAFPAGHLADKYGSKRILTLGVLGMAVSSILVGLSIGTAGFAATYALLGIFASIHHPAGLSLIARRIEKKGKALGLHGVMGNVGLFLSPLFAGLCVLLFNTWRAAYLIYGVMGLVFFLILYFAEIEHEPNLSWHFGILDREKGAGELAQPPQEIALAPEPPPATIPMALLVLYLGSILSGFIFRGSLTFLPALLQKEINFIAVHDEPVVVAGFVTTAILSLGLFSSWFGGYINDKIKKPEVFPVIIFIIVSPMLYLMSRYTDNGLLVASALFSLVYYAWQPSQNYLIAKYTRKASHGKGFGVNFFLIFGMGSMATAIGGYVADKFGVDVFYNYMSIIGFSAIAAALAVFAAKPYLLKIRFWTVKESIDLQ